MNPEIIATLQTVARLHQFKKDLLSLRDSMYRTDASREDLSQKFIFNYPFIGKELITSPEQIDQLLKQLDTLTKSSVEVHVQSAIPLNDETLTLIYNSLSGTVKKPLLLLSSIDETLLGGLVIIINGRQYDYSLLKIAQKELNPTHYDHV